MRIGLVSLRKGSGCPPLGLVYYGTWLQEQGHEVDIIDAQYPKVNKKLAYEQIGISSMTVDYEKARKMGRWVKENTKTKVTIGGIHISTCPESFDSEAFDEMVIGEGEKCDINDLPRPNWDLVNKRYFEENPNTTFGEFGIEGVLMTSRGCPYNCIFCSTKSFWGKPRFHTPVYVAKCIQDLRQKGVTHIQIWDDLFTINKARIKEIKRFMDIFGINGIKFNCQPRTDLIDDEMCEILKDFGVTKCIFGFESGSNEVLKYLKANTTTVEQNKKAIELCHKHGLGVQGSVIFGSPNETLKEMNKTLEFMDWCYNNGVERLWSFNLTPFPGTKIWDWGVFHKINSDWSVLSHTKQPLLLHESITERQWDMVQHLRDRYEDKFKMNKVKSFLSKNPLKTIKYGLTHIGEVIKSVNTHT